MTAELDRVKKLTHVKGTNWSGDYRYTYNAVDQITQMEEMIHPTGPEEPGPIHSFQYDNLQRLTSEAHTNQSPQSFSYDQVGHCLSDQSVGISS